MDQRPTIWFYRIFRVVHLPTWLGVLLPGLIPYLVVGVAGDAIAGGLYHSDFLANVGALVPLTIVIVLIPLFGSIYISRTMEKVKAYALSLLEAPEVTKDTWNLVNFRSLYSIRTITMRAVCFFVMITVVYTAFTTASEQLYYFAVSPAFVYAFFVDMTFVWTYVYSMH